jgi:hypothetical protein
MRFTLILSSIVFSILCKGQSFEGTITYTCDLQVSESMEKVGITTLEMKERMIRDGKWSDTITTTYKEGNYFSRAVNRSPVNYAIYRSSDNAIYTFEETSGSEFCTAQDASRDLDAELTGKAPTVTRLDTIAYVNSIECNIVRVKWNAKSYYDYYYKPGYLPVTAALFSKHIYDGWAAYLKIAGALPIKIVKKSMGMTATLTMNSVHQAPVDDTQFSIPQLKVAKGMDHPNPATKMMKIIPIK